MIRLAIYGRPTLIKHIDYLKDFFQTIYNLEFEYYIQNDLQKAIQPQIPTHLIQKTFSNYDDFITLNIDFVISLGGDGTILDTLTLVKDSGIPVLGINLGRLGFLASVNKEHTENALVSLIKGAYSIDKRGLLELKCNIPIFIDENIALNEMTIRSNNTSSMITVHAYVNGELLNSYFADGLIISTPTGSTGYSLSCGGPIIHPDSGNFIITPIAPHNLNVRPIVLSDTSTLTFEVEGRSKEFLCTLDSRVSTITYLHQLAIKKANYCMNLVRLNDNSFLDALKEKLLWGSDQRS